MSEFISELIASGVIERKGICLAGVNAKAICYPWRGRSKLFEAHPSRNNNERSSIRIIHALRKQEI